MATALVSLFTDQPVKPKLTMTGEITLRGIVLQIGGLKEKSLAALRAGFKEVIIPKENERDLIDLPSEVKSGIKFYGVERVDEVFRLAFPKERRARKRQT